MVNVKIKVLSSGKLPIYSRQGDACLDCYARESVTIKKGERTQVPLGFCLELPPDYEAQVRPRSGMSKRGVDIAFGTCDSNYRGEVQATVINNNGEDYIVDKGDRICQLAIREAPKVFFDIVDKLSDTDRGSDGFGSSGK